MPKNSHSFLFADLAGYSMLTELEGDEAAADLALGFAAAVARMAAEHDAELVRHIGDAVLVHGADAAEMVELGLRLNEELGAGPLFPLLHAGIHTGPAVKRAGEWWGATVNVAARVGAAAAAGELLLSEATVMAADRGLSRFSTGLKSLGPRRFKNISEPVWVYSASGAPASRRSPHPARGLEARLSDRLMPEPALTIASA
jgi:class 3 adenylate cyclase